MAVIGTAFVSVVPTARGFANKLNGELSAAGTQGGKRYADSFSGSAGGVLKGLAAKVGAIGLGSLAVLGLKAGIQTAAGLEQANIAFETMLGSATKARDLMAEIKKFAKTTPFELPEVVQGAKQLLAFGFAQEEVIETMRRLGDIASGVGVPVGQLVNVFGQVRTSGRLMGQDLLQFTSAGVPIIKALADTMGVAQSEIKGMVEAGKVGFPEVQAAIESLTNKGGQFGGLMEKQATSLVGVWSNFTDSANLALADAFKPFAPAVKAAITTATDFITTGTSTFKTKIQEIKDAFGGLDFDDVNAADGEKLGLALTAGLGRAVKSIGKLGGQVADQVGKMLKSVDWVGLGIKAGPAVLGLVLGLATGIINGITDPGLWSSIIDHLPQILLAVISIALAPAKLVGPIASALGKIPFAGKFIEAILTGRFGINTVGGRIKGAVVALMRDVARAFADGFGRIRIPGAGLVAKVVAALRMIPSRVSAFFGTLATQFGVHALTLAERLGRGLRTAGSKAVSAMRDIPSKIKGVFGDAGSMLYGIGKSIVEGLLNGLKSKLKEVVATAKELGAAIKNNKGPESADKVMLFPAGRWIVGGLISGIEKETPTLLRALAGVSSSISSSISPDILAATSNAGPAPVYVVNAREVADGVQRVAESVVSEEKSFASTMGRMG